MKLGHVIYAVKDLDKAVREWTRRGFEVEYGRLRSSKAHNAFIYFGEGPYIELLEGGGMSQLERKLTSIFYGKKYAERFEYLAELPEGWAGLCIIKDGDNLDNEIDYLRSIDIDGRYVKNIKYRDAKKRLIKYKCFYTYDYDMPYFMTSFEADDPRPVEIMHPNGIRGISRVTFHTTRKYANTLRGLVRDNTLNLSETFNTGIDKVEFHR